MWRWGRDHGPVCESTMIRSQSFSVIVPLDSKIHMLHRPPPIGLGRVARVGWIKVFIPRISQALVKVSFEDEPC